MIEIYTGSYVNSQSLEPRLLAGTANWVVQVHKTTQLRITGLSPDGHKIIAAFRPRYALGVLSVGIAAKAVTAGERPLEDFVSLPPSPRDRHGCIAILVGL